MDQRNKLKASHTAYRRWGLILGSIFGVVLIGLAAILSLPPVLSRVVPLPTITREATKTKMPTIDVAAYSKTLNATLKKSITPYPTMRLTEPPTYSITVYQPYVYPTIPFQGPYVRPIYIPPPQKPPR